MAAKKKPKNVAKGAPTTPPPATRTANAAAWEAEKLTGLRAQSGKLPDGNPKWTYEVQWKGTKWPNTFEPATHLIGWEKEMSEVDAKVAAKAKLPEVNLAKMATEARKAAAEKRHVELQSRRAMLERASRKRARGADESAPDDEEEEEDTEVRDLSAEQLLEEMVLVAQQLAAAGIKTKQTGTAPDAGTPAAEQVEPRAPRSAADKPAKQRKKLSRVWKAFDPVTHRCILPHVHNKGEVCNAPPNQGTGTSGYIQHLEKVHFKEWANILLTGEVKTTVAMIKDALAAQVDQSLPNLNVKDSVELDRLVALWVTKCQRSMAIVDDAEFATLLARILKLTKSKYRWSLPSRPTMRKQGDQDAGPGGQGARARFCRAPAQVRSQAEHNVRPLVRGRHEPLRHLRARRFGNVGD